jgi:hypothetical protein
LIRPLSLSKVPPALSRFLLRIADSFRQPAVRALSACLLHALRLSLPAVRPG